MLAVEDLSKGNPPGALTCEEAGSVLIQEEVGGQSLAHCPPLPLTPPAVTSKLIFRKFGLMEAQFESD